MTNSQRVRKLVQTSNHNNGSISLRRARPQRLKIHKRSATLLAILLCVATATLAALDASSSQPQDATLQLNTVDSNQHPTFPSEESTTSASSPPVTNNSTTNASVTSDSSSSSTTITVNGKTITVPINGTYQQTTSDNNESTSIKVDRTSSDSSQNSSSVNINVNSQSSNSNQ